MQLCALVPPDYKVNIEHQLRPADALAATLVVTGTAAHRTTASALALGLKKRRTIVSKACKACRQAKAKCDNFKVRDASGISKAASQVLVGHFETTNWADPHAIRARAGVLASGRRVLFNAGDKEHGFPAVEDAYITVPVPQGVATRGWTRLGHDIARSGASTCRATGLGAGVRCTYTI